MEVFKAFVNAVIFTLVLNVNVHAQYVFYSTAEIETEDGIISAWPASKIKETIPFGFIKIIDNRTDTTVIGLNSAKFIRMKAAGDQVWSLQQVVDELYKNRLAKNNDTLVMIINKLILASNMHYQKGSWQYQEDITDGLRIQTNFYRQVPNGYRQVKAFHYFNNPVLETRKNWASDMGWVKKDINSNWSEYLVSLLDTAVTALIKASNQPVPDSIQVLPDLTSLKTNTKMLPVNRATTLKKGVYRNYVEFTTNEPGIAFDDEKKLAATDTSCWGYCDGKNIFIRKATTFYQAEIYHGAWYLSSSINALRKKTRQADLDHVFGFSFFRALTHPEEGRHGSKEESPLLMIRIQNKNIMALQVDRDTGLATF